MKSVSLYLVVTTILQKSKLFRGVASSSLARVSFLRKNIFMSVSSQASLRWIGRWTRTANSRASLITRIRKSIPRITYFKIVFSAPLSPALAPINQKLPISSWFSNSARRSCSSETWLLFRKSRSWTFSRVPSMSRPVSWWSRSKLLELSSTRKVTQINLRLSNLGASWPQPTIN